MSVIQSWQRSRTAEFTASPRQSGTVITVHGEIDAANANQLTEYVQRALRQSHRLVLDLRDLDFIGTAGFSALHRINFVCSAADAHWVLIPGRAVRHLLRVCDPDAALPTADRPVADDRAKSRAARGLLQLVPQPR